MFDPSDLDTITGAYHEAGHVVMAHILGGEVVHVTIENDDDELLGLTTVRWRKSDDAERRRCSALVALAGPVAETRWRGEADLLDTLTAWHGDWQEIEQALAAETRAANGSNGDAGRLLHQWLHEVLAQFEDTMIWEHLCRVAEALEAHGTLDDAMLDDVLERG